MGELQEINCKRKQRKKLSLLLTVLFHSSLQPFFLSCDERTKRPAPAKKYTKKGELAFSSKVAGEGIEPPAFGL